MQAPAIPQDPTVQALSQEATTLQLAQGLLADREFDRCLVVLHTAQQLRGRHPTLMTLTAICRAQKYGAHHEWFKVGCAVPWRQGMAE